MEKLDSGPSVRVHRPGSGNNMSIPLTPVHDLERRGIKVK